MLYFDKLNRVCWGNNHFQQFEYLTQYEQNIFYQLEKTFGKDNLKEFTILFSKYCKKIAYLDEHKTTRYVYFVNKNKVQEFKEQYESLAMMILLTK